MVLAEIQVYLQEIARFEVPSEEEVQQLFREHRSHDIIVRNLRLVVKIARKYEHLPLSLDDLIQEGSLGLMRAVQLYEPAKGEFRPYAYYWIEAKIRLALKQPLRSMGVPKEKITRLAHLRRFWKEQHPQQELSDAAPAQIAASIGWTEQEVVDMLAIERLLYVESLATRLSDEEDVTLADTLQAKEEEQPEYRVFNDHPPMLMTTLTKNERIVISLRLGLNGEEWTQAAIAEHMGWGVGRVRNTLTRALFKLRQEVARKHDSENRNKVA